MIGLTMGKDNKPYNGGKLSQEEEEKQEETRKLIQEVYGDLNKIKPEHGDKKGSPSNKDH